MTGEAIIRIEQLRKRYGGAVAVSLDSLVLESGDRAAISGENGSGKSTLLKILAGLVQISSGTDVRREDWKKLPIGFLPQDGGIYRDLSVRENLTVIQRLLGAAADKARPAILAEQFGLTDVMDKRVEHLSGGYRRLATLLCLLSSGAALLFMDEPFASLDPIKQHAIGEALKQSEKEFELIVISEHINNIPVADLSSFWRKRIPLESRNHAQAPQT